MQSLKVKVLTAFMSVIMVFSLFPALNSGASTVLDSASCGANLTATLSADGKTLTISGTGAMNNYSYDSTKKTYNTPWFGARTSIKKVVIKDGVTSIGNFAFVYLTQLEEVVWPTNGSLKSIGKCAFGRCYGLKKISIPNGVTSIGYEAFLECTNLTSVSLPGSLKSVAYGAFAYCDIRKVFIPSKVTSLGDFAFASNHKNASVTGGAGLVSIGRQAFQHNWALKTFKITSKKLKKIGTACFLCDSKLKTIQIKKTTKLKKKGVKGSLYLSSVKKVKVKKSKVRKYKKFFTYRNCGKRGVKVKK